MNHEAPVMDDSVYFDVIPQSSEATIHSPFEPKPLYIEVVYLTVKFNNVAFFFLLVLLNR